MDLTLKDTLQEFLLHHDLIGRDREAHFIVAFSGGRDSTALLHCLAELKTSSDVGINITAAYYWHPWRPLQQDLQVVHQSCKALNIPWVMLTPNLTLPKTETAAREDRYRQLTKLALDLDAAAILTAHHQDDQIETILFRLFRGTGLDGITGIPSLRLLSDDTSKPVWLARPFIDTPRNRVDDYVQARGLRYVDDPTNTNTQLKRNAIRHELLPQIEQAFPHVRQSIIRLASLVEGEIDIIENKIDEIWQDVFDSEEQSLDEIRFNQLSPPFQRRIMRCFLNRAGQEAGFQKIEDIIGFLAGKNRNIQMPSLHSLDAKHFLHVYRNRITIESPQQSSIAPVPVQIPGQVTHLDLKTTVSIIPLTAEQKLRNIDFSRLPDNEVYVDLSKFTGSELILRSRQKGDRIKPLGMSSPMKLKRFFINRCIPRFKRDSIPLLAADSEVLWAVGVEISEQIRVKDRPTHLITVKKEV